MAKSEKIEAFGQELRQRREAAGIDQKVLAARVGISPQHLNQMEKAYSRPGRPPVGPGDDVISGISETLGWRVLDIRRTLGQIPEGEIEYVANPDAARLVEHYNNADERDRRIVDLTLGLDKETEGGDEPSAARLAFDMDREGAHGKRAE